MLMNHGDSSRQRIFGPFRPVSRAVERKCPLGRAEYPEGEIAERGFAGTVFAEQAMDFTRGETDINPIKRRECAKTLGNAREFKKVGHTRPIRTGDNGAGRGIATGPRRGISLQVR